MAEANAEIGPPHVADIFADRRLLGAEPGIFVLLPHILRATHHQHHVERLEVVGNGLALIELDRGPAKSIVAEEIEQNSGRFNCCVLEDEDIHEAGLKDWNWRCPLIGEASVRGKR